MFEFLKRIQKEAMTATKSNERKTQELVEEIHESFYTEVDKLLAYAKIEKSTGTSIPDILEKSNRLRSLGFTSTQTSEIARKEEARLDEIKKENQKRRSLVEAINYFSQKYPQYKFITEDSVKKICEKYNLVYATVDRFIGNVPNKNLEEIEKFKIENIDCLYSLTYSSHWSREIVKIGSEKDLFEYKRIYRDKGYFSDNVRKALLEIAAPISDFDLKDHEIKNFKLQKKEIPDPIVLQPVQYKNEKYYLIVTAWGPEASDHLVVNQRMN